jgi:5-methylthioadenosine/S-adenosylhomocysteine deaminase
MHDIIFINATIITFNQPVKIQSLAITGNKISYLGTGKPKSVKTIDLKGKVIIPGLINCHTHAAMNAFRGLADDLPLKEWLEKHIWPAEKANLSAQFVKKWVKQACQEMAGGGITTFSDMYFYQKEASRVASNFGLRMFAGEAIIDFKPNSRFTAEDMLKGPTKPLKYNIIAPHSTYTVNKTELIECKKLAKKFSLKMAIHTAESKNQKNDIRYLHKLNLLDKNTILVHAIYLNQKDLELIAQNQTKIVHCPQSNMKLASGIAPISQMIKLGITVGLGTDSAASNNTLDLFREMKTAALLGKVSQLDSTVLPAEIVFKMATINGAKILGIEKETGSIEVGKLADLAIIDFDQVHLKPVTDYFSHLVYCAQSSDVVATICNGKFIYDRIN